ncbi:adhesion G-protein coupled receptor G4 isoform X1 [Hydra vulgaris]|uniref:adhesion G-protein coupled receptor G4 isoform X1 n=2 Tax=Hydra vulgaris TaxID=6087 RepID=UPI000640D893|nr:adhesion G-protein coupled receptor G4-like isoform X2 [Hydra vulgaris]
MKFFTFLFIKLLYMQFSTQQYLSFSQIENSSVEIEAGSILKLPSCRFTALIIDYFITKDDIFWLKNGVKRIYPVNDSVLTDDSFRSVNGTVRYIFPSLEIKTVLSDGGTYQCGVQITKLMEKPVYSDKFEVKIKAQVVTIVSKIQFRYLYNSAVLYNCMYNANEDLHKFAYWLLNGEVVFTGSNELASDMLPFQSSKEQYEVPPLTITSYDMIGSYQCVIFDNSTMIEKVISDVFVIAKQPEPSFLTNPSVIGERNIEVGSSISILGCVFDTYFILKEDDVYWLKDGIKKINANVYFLEGSVMLPRRYRFSNIVINQLNYYDHGYYQCVINLFGSSSNKIKSVHFNLQLPDTSFMRLKLWLNKEWILEYLKQSSSDSKVLRNFVKKSIEETVSPIAKSVIYYPTIIVNITDFSSKSAYITSQITIGNLLLGVVDTLKWRLFNAMVQNLNKDSFPKLNVMNVKLQSLDSCPANVFGETNYKGQYTFEMTFVNQDKANVLLNCTYQSNGFVQRICHTDLKNGAFWDVPDLTNCEPKTETTKKLIQLNKESICVRDVIENCVLINVVSKNLSDTVRDGSEITNYHDVNFISKALETIVSVFIKAKDASDQVFIDVLQTIDIVLGSNKIYIAESQVKKSSSTSILNTLTEFALIYSKQLNKSISVSKKNIGFHIDKVKKSNVIITAQQLANNSVGISFSNNVDITNKTFAVIKIPSEVFSDENDIIYSYFFRYDSFLLNENSLLHPEEKNIAAKKFVQSAILSASIVDRNVSKLRNPIILTFKKILSEYSGISNCHYWDEKIKTGIINVSGSWLRTGCYRYEAGTNTDEYFTCACDHLTNFALLLDVDQSLNNPLELKIITYIGCGISLIGLLLTLFTLAVFRNLRKKLPQRILICLCISLMGLLLVFLIGAEKTSPIQLCQVIAAVLHYFILSTFCWMLVEAFNLYLSFVIVFNKRNDSNVFRIANIFAWGFPAIIVIITGVSRPDQLGNEKICLVRGYPFYFAVLLPVCLILIVNFVVLIITMLSLSKRVKAGKEVTATKNYLSQIRIAFICATLLGLSWLFAVLAIKDLSVIFQWIFCITTSLQGFFIFIFNILRKKDVMNEWRKCYGHYRQYNIASSSNNPKSSDIKPLKTIVSKN